MAQRDERPPWGKTENMQKRDRLSAAKVLPLSVTRQLGRGLYRYLDSTGSTNDDAREMGEAGALHGSMVVAEMQTSGRGRHDRVWVSPPATGIYATLLLRPGLPPEETPLITFAAVVALAEAVQQTCGLTPTIKWPNDLLVNGRKVAGILTETVTTGMSVDFVLTGIGINVNTPAGVLPERVLFPASSLAVEAGRRFSRAALLGAWLGCFERWLDGLCAGERTALTGRWMEFAGMIGCNVAVKDMPGEIRGIVTGITPEGALLLRTEDGQMAHILSGDLYSTATLSHD